jgi:hypothetical protein
MSDNDQFYREMGSSTAFFRSSPVSFSYLLPTFPISYFSDFAVNPERSAEDWLDIQYIVEHIYSYSITMVACSRWYYGKNLHDIVPSVVHSFNFSSTSHRLSRES